MTANSPFPARPWKVIQVQGTDREQGRQHAEQLGAECEKGMPRFYHRLLVRLLGERPEALADRLALAALKRLIDPFLVNRLLKQVPLAQQERVLGMAEASHLDVRELQIALVLPDLLPLLQTGLCRLFPRRFIAVQPPELFGCSSFIHNGEHFLVGRNLDFPGVAYWDRYPVIQVSTPVKGLRYLSFTSSGVPIGGITGVNEAQVYVAVHQHFARVGSFSGVLPFVVAERILGQATNLSEALSILGQARLSTSWAFILADGKNRTGLVWEGGPKAHGVRRLPKTDPVLAHSNYFQTPQCQATEFAATARMNWDNHCRKSRLEELIRRANPLTPALACAALSDHRDPFWDEEAIVNRTVSQLFNIQSLVLDPQRMQAWVAEGDSPIHLNQYRHFDLGKLFSGAVSSGEALSGYRFQDEAKGRAKRQFTLSFVAAMDGDEISALEYATQALETSFAPELAQTAAVLCLRSHRFDQAKDLLERAVDCIERRLLNRPGTEPPPEYYELRLFQGRVLDLQGKASQARTHYDFVYSAENLRDENLRRIAHRGRYRAAELDRLILPYSSYVMFS